MIPVSTLQGKRVALFGLGGSGLVTARALVAGGANVLAWDDNPTSVEKAAAEDIATGDLRMADWSTFARFVVAPGVPLTHPKPHWTVEMAKAAGVGIVGDVGLFFEEMAASCRRAPIIAITGTNGKSTTTALVAHVLRAAGRDVQMGGNIGRAVLDLDPVASGAAAAGQVYVVEVSSYQIDTAPTIQPHVGVLLNLSPDHLERHGTMENYSAIKRRLVAGADLAVVGMDDPNCRAIATGLGRAGRPVTTISSNDAPPAAEVWFDGSAVRRTFGPVAELSAVGSLRGAHNGQNAAAALAACEAVGLSTAEIQTGFETFPGLAHRMEQVGHVGPTLFVNDSKATNAEAAAPALSSFQTVHWVAGGLAKSGGIEALLPLLGRVSRAYLVGEAAGTFAAQIGDTIPYEISGTVEDAVNHAARDAAQAGGEQVVLLSPAAASFDQFPNFEKRGDAFKAAVARLDGFEPIS